MVKRRSTAGFSMLEATIALAVVAAVAGTFLWSGPDTARATGAAYRASAAHRLATGVLEQSGAEPLQAGTSTVPVPDDSAVAGAKLIRRVHEREPGLFEVTAVVEWREPGETTPRTSRLTTLVAQERAR